jgi:hypothetical protein
VQSTPARDNYWPHVATAAFCGTMSIVLHAAGFAMLHSPWSILCFCAAVSADVLFGIIVGLAISGR